jgi:hypothetical protein
MPNSFLALQRYSWNYVNQVQFQPNSGANPYFEFRAFGPIKAETYSMKISEKDDLEFPRIGGES